MPTTRGAERGSKKRYAGTVRKDGSIELVVRGLEAVRRDWSPLARRVQVELLRRAFADEPFDEWLRSVSSDLMRGVLDAELAIRRRNEAGAPEDQITTTEGIQPAHARTAPIDHAHYRDKQLAPVCDVLLPFLGTSFDAIAGVQTKLF
jgi:DNA polymerase-2